MLRRRATVDARGSVATRKALRGERCVCFVWLRGQNEVAEVCAKLRPCLFNLHNSWQMLL
jgi:hypothetical protein